MFKKLIFTIFLILSATFSYSQYVNDALKFSSQNTFGTSKFNSMSGAFGSLGGDFSNLSHNPAGLGMYQFSEFTYTNSFGRNIVTSDFRNIKERDWQINSQTENIGIVLSNPKSDLNVKRINFGVGWNQTASFNERIFIASTNSENSLADVFLSRANGHLINDLDPFLEYLAFWTDVIDLADNSIDTSTNYYLYDNGNYISHVNSVSEKFQYLQKESSGYTGEVPISLATSIDDKLYMGVSMGIPIIEYSERTLYGESSFSDTISDLTAFDLNRSLIVSGSGINIKAGAIYRLNNNFRVGLSAHSPSYISIQEEFNSSMRTSFSNGESSSESSPYGFFEYDLITPWKIILGASSTFNNLLLSIDYETIDYSFISLQSDIERFSEENDFMSTNYVRTNNIKIGGEYRTNNLSLRFGYSEHGSPIKDNEDFNLVTNSIGIGYSIGNYFIDASYTNSKGKQNYNLYAVNGVSETAELEKDRHRIVLGIGLKF